jgi:hypothetical protein
MSWKRLRRSATELAVISVPAIAALWAVPPFSWSVPAALVACGLLPLRHIWPPLAVLAALWGLAGGLAWPAALVALYALGRRGAGVSTTVPWLVPPVVAAVTPILLTQALPWQRIVLTVAFVALYAIAPTSLGLLMTTRERLTESLRDIERARDKALTASRGAGTGAGADRPGDPRLGRAPRHTDRGGGRRDRHHHHGGRDAPWGRAAPGARQSGRWRRCGSLSACSTGVSTPQG